MYKLKAELARALDEESRLRGNRGEGLFGAEERALDFGFQWTAQDTHFAKAILKSNLTSIDAAVSTLLKTNTRQASSLLLTPPVRCDLSTSMQNMITFLFLHRL